MMLGGENSVGRFNLFLHNVGIFYKDSHNDYRKDSWPLTAMITI